MKEIEILGETINTNIFGLTILIILFAGLAVYAIWYFIKKAIENGVTSAIKKTKQQTNINQINDIQNKESTNQENHKSTYHEE